MSGMLIAPTLGIDVNTMLLLYITAFGAAALGAFDNLIITFVTAIAIGIATNVIGDSLHPPRAVPAQLLHPGAIHALVAALLFVPGQVGRTRRGRVASRHRSPGSRARCLLPVGVAAAIFAVVLPHVVSGADVSAYTVALGFGMILLSLGLLVWSSGQISLCQMAFAAVGASPWPRAEFRIPVAACPADGRAGDLPVGALSRSLLSACPGSTWPSRPSASDCCSRTSSTTRASCSPSTVRCRSTVRGCSAWTQLRSPLLTT